MRRLSLSREMSLARFFVFLVTLRPCFHSHSNGLFLPDAGWGPKSSPALLSVPRVFHPRPLAQSPERKNTALFTVNSLVCVRLVCVRLCLVLVRPYKNVFVFVCVCIFVLCFFFNTSQDFPPFRFYQRTADKQLPSSTTGAAKPLVFAPPPRSPAFWHSFLLT